MVQISTDENESTFSLSPSFQSPAIAEVATKQHVDTLEHEFLIHALYGKYTLVSEQSSPWYAGLPTHRSNLLTFIHLQISY